MAFTSKAALEAREIIPGFHGKMVHTDRVTFAIWQIEQGSVLPEHAHPHEQITTVLSGTFELTIAGETRRVTQGDIAIIPGNIPHSGQAITACELHEVFCPTREEYR